MMQDPAEQRNRADLSCIVSDASGKRECLQDRRLHFLQTHEVAQMVTPTEEHADAVSTLEELRTHEGEIAEVDHGCVTVRLLQVVQRPFEEWKCSLRRPAPQMVFRQEPGGGPGNVLRIGGSFAVGKDPGDQRVVLRPEESRELCVHDLLDLMVIESVGFSRRPHNAGPPLNGGEALQDSHALLLQCSRHEPRVEFESLHCADVEDCPLLLGEVLQASRDQVLHRRRNLDVIDRLGVDPAPVRALLDELTLLQPLDHLEHEERNAVRLLRDARPQLFDQPLASKRIAQQADDVSRPEAARLDTLEVVHAIEETQLGFVEPGARSQQQEHAMSGHAAGEGEKELALFYAREVEILDHEEEGLFVRERACEVERGLHAARPLGRIARPRAALRIEARP